MQQGIEKEVFVTTLNTNIRKGYMDKFGKEGSKIAELIEKGREQGYLTYADVNDHLPEDISELEQFEEIIGMIEDLGLTVHEKAPALIHLCFVNRKIPMTWPSNKLPALAAVENETGRTTDPVRMYMREMGTVDLLTREGEIEIAKRIEEGMRDLLCWLSISTNRRVCFRVFSTG